jgi:hypothetical protein
LLDGEHHTELVGVDADVIALIGMGASAPAALFPAAFRRAVRFPFRRTTGSSSSPTAPEPPCARSRDISAVTSPAWTDYSSCQHHERGHRPRANLAG